MADHIRKQLRAAAAVTLGALATSGARVYPSRTIEMQDANLPGLRIYTNDEEIESLHATDASGDDQRTIQLVVECCSKKASGMDDELDAMIKEVEVALSSDQDIAGAKWNELRSTRIEMEGEAEKDVGVARMTWDVVFYTARGAPDVAI